MSQEAKLGRELKFFWNDTEVGGLTSVGFNVDGNVVDISSYDSGDFTDYTAGRKDWSISLSCVHEEFVSGSQQSEIISDFIDNNVSGSAKFGPSTPSGSDVTYSGDAFVTNFSIDASDDERIESSFELQGSGVLTRNVGT